VDVLDKDSGVRVRTPMATAFLMEVPVEDVGTSYYAITAEHVINESRPYGQLYLRVNTENGDYHDLPCPKQDDWETHPSSDVAATPLQIEDITGWDISFLPVGMLTTDERATKEAVGEGDEITMVGLFASRPGATRSEPVVRFGHISAMPQLVSIKVDGGPTASVMPRRAYLVEAASWGGESGSPVFIYFGPHRMPWSPQARTPGVGFGLLGLLHGHYPHIEKIDIRAGGAVLVAGGVVLEGSVDLNKGISIVIPAQEILDLLNGDVFMGQRRWGADKIRKQQGDAGPQPDSALGEPSEFERFEGTLAKLAQVPKSEVDEQRKKS